MTTATAPAEQCTIPVTGMTCAGCSGKVQRSLETTSGVSGANVNLMTGTATVSYDPAVTSPGQLVEVIRATGYGAELPTPGRSEEELFEAHEAERAAEMAGLGRKLVVSGVAIAIVMLAGMGLGGHAAGAASRWLQLVATLPVVFWAGRHFYTRAWNAFRHHSADMNTLIAVGTGAAFAYSVVVTLRRGVVRCPWRRAARVLRAGGFHHRAHPLRQSSRGQGSRSDVGRGPQAGGTAACHGPGHPRWGGA